jgi:hypothetical protein
MSDKIQTADPVAEFRPWPFFVLNDEFLPESGEARLTEFLENLHRVGFGGVFIHPRPGMITEYLGPRWFELVRHIIAECRRLGMEPALYDENSYPSGFAGGHVPARIPDAVVRAVSPVFGTGPVDVPVFPMKLYRYDGDQVGETVSREAITDGDSWVAFVEKIMEPTAWHGGFPYVSLLDPQVMPAFLEITHERYRAELNDDEWNSLRAIFTDEPHLPAENHGSWSAGLHFTPWVRASFKKRCGYDLVEKLPGLYWNSEESAAVRFDYYETLHALFVTHWAKPLENWCDEHSLPLTGHYLEHDWPCPYATPGHMHLLKYMQWPGTDLLETYLLEGHDGGDPQNLAATLPGREAQALFFLRQAQSVANQFGKERVSCESWGAGGNDSAPADWLRIGRFLIVHGVNLLVPHIAPVTIRGSRKTDHPQFFSEVTACFDHLKPMNDEFGTLCEWTTRGRMENRILLVDPLTTGFCLARKSDCLGMQRQYDESLRPDFIALTQRSLKGLRESTTELAEALSEACVDFDIGDEYILEEDGCVEETILTVGIQHYEAVVLPPQLQNLRETTVQLLEAFVQNGGQLVALRPETAWVDGRVADWPARLDSAGAVQWAGSTEELIKVALAAVPPRVKCDTAFPVGFAHQRRADGDRVIYLFVNSGATNWSGQIALAESGDAVALTIPACEARVLVVDSAGAVSVEGTTDARPEWTPCSAELAAVQVLEKNTWVIDTCGADINGESFGEELVYAANRRYWEAAGLSTNGWHMVVQFRDQMFRRARELSPDLQAAFAYRVDIAEGVATADWELAVEAPELWTVVVNGQRVDFSESQTWRDCHIRRVGIGGLLHAGENRIVLSSDAFDVRQEIDQIYLFGDFALEPVTSGFRAVAPKPLGLGAWKKQGRPFFDHEAAYSFDVAQSGSVRVQLACEDWSGSVVQIETACETRLSYGPAVDETVQVGDDRRITLKVTGLPLNTFGPFRVADPRPKRAWSVQWAGPDIPTGVLPGNEYRLMDFGLFQLPQFSVEGNG